ncbi:MAG: acyl-CoA dehydrogenase family protein [Thermodesulfobacteriota bacterium]|nr:acyl-CoA dehydrogenase family protein [Thermodesulfobacteriota bacterium]
MRQFFNEQQEMLRKTVKRMAREKIAPIAAEIDEKREFPKYILDIFHEMGLMTITVPEEYGGMGGGVTDVSIVLEEIAKESGSLAGLPFGNLFLTTALRNAGSQEQRERFYSKLVKNQCLVAFCISEANAGSDVASIKSRAVLEGDNYIINGTKQFISNASGADLFIILASTDPSQKGNGLSIFILQKNYSGLSIGKKEMKMGIRGIPSNEVILENVHVPKENRLGEEGHGFVIAMGVLDWTRLGIGAWAVGLAEGALDYALNYAKEREAFGQPIAMFQGLQFMLADMAMQVEAARSLVYLTAARLDGGEENLNKYTSMCKCFATDVAMKVCTDAVQVLGGYGYMQEYPVERMMRDAKGLQILEGTSQIQRVVIAKELFS